MIELEESINLAKVEQITAERMRKSSRLLRDSKSQQRIQLRKLEKGKLSKLGQRGEKQWNWQQLKYTQLLKLIRFTTKQDSKEKQPQIIKSLDHNDDSQSSFSQHFKGSWKPSLESEILISHCKQQCKSIKYPTQISYQQHRHKSRHEGIQIRKDRSHELNLFKSNLRNSYNRCLNKKSKPSFIKHLLKIEDHPLIALDQITPKFNQRTKESVTIKPLKKVRERLKSLTPQKPKQEIQKKKSLPLNSINKKSHHRHQSSYLKKVDVSAWTFHNIDQQTI